MPRLPVSSSCMDAGGLRVAFNWLPFPGGRAGSSRSGASCYEAAGFYYLALLFHVPGRGSTLLYATRSLFPSLSFFSLSLPCNLAGRSAVKTHSTRKSGRHANSLARCASFSSSVSVFGASFIPGPLPDVARRRHVDDVMLFAPPQNPRCSVTAR